MTEKHVPVDLSLAQPGWNVKKLDNKWAPTYEAITRRARVARVYIRDRILELQKESEKDPEIVVVTHGGLLHYFTEDWEDSGAYNGEFPDHHYFGIFLSCSDACIFFPFRS